MNKSTIEKLNSAPWCVLFNDKLYVVCLCMCVGGLCAVYADKPMHTYFYGGEVDMM